MAYTLSRLAAGSYDLMLDGTLVGSVVQDVVPDNSLPSWRAVPLADNPAAKKPAPFSKAELASYSHAATGLASPTAGGHLSGMSVEFAYRFFQQEPEAILRELDDVVLTVAVKSDDGDMIPAGTEGTIVSVHDDCKTCVVEFAEPEGALATVEPHEIRAVEHANP